MRSRQAPDRCGAAAVEFAITLPFLLFLLIIGADWARLLYFKIEVDGGARAGALWAADPTRQVEAAPGWDSLKNAVLRASPNLPSTITVTQTTATANSIPVYRVTVTMQFTTLTNFAVLNYFVPQTTTITRTVEMRELPLVPN